MNLGCKEGSGRRIETDREFYVRREVERLLKK
jgi:hypothetical protein